MADLIDLPEFDAATGENAWHFDPDPEDDDYGQTSHLS